MAESQDNSIGILGAVSSVAQQATSVVSNALEAMHITAPHDQEKETQDVNGKAEVDQEDKKDAAELEEGEIREANGKEEKQGPKTVFDDPASFNLKVSFAPFSLDGSFCVAEGLSSSTVCLHPCAHPSPFSLAPIVHPMDTVFRLTQHQEPAQNASSICSWWRRCRKGRKLDGGYQKGRHL